MSISQFTLNAYRHVVKLASERRKFVLFTEAHSANQMSVLWRHDVDVSLRTAVHIAEIDAEQQVTSTFFVNIHSDTYNTRSRVGRRQVAEIHAMGHEVGIHLDSSYYGHFENQSALERALSDEVAVFMDEFSLQVKVFSFHNPTSHDLQHSNPTYAGLINTYSADFQQKIPYVSDSNGYWRYQSIPDFLADENATTVQVLTHPEWWTAEALMPRERLCRALFEDVFLHMSEYDQFLAAVGRENHSDVFNESPSQDAIEVGIQSFEAAFRSSAVRENPSS